MTIYPLGSFPADPPALMPTTHDKPARAGAPMLHPDPQVRSDRADQAWEIAHDPTARPAQVRAACHIIIANATDYRRDMAQQLLKVFASAATD